MALVTITQVKGTIDRPATQKKTLVALGLGRLHKSVTVESTPQIMGMVKKVYHLISVK